MSDGVEHLLNSAVEALQGGNTAVCISLSSQALQQLSSGDRRIPEALSLRGTARLRTDPAAAMQDLQQAVQLDPAEPQFLTALGQAFVTLGQLDDAEHALRQAWQLSKGHPVVTDLWARVCLQKGNAFQAVQLLGPLVQSGKASAGMVRQFGEALFHSGDIYGARDVLSHLFGETGPQTVEDRLQLARIDMALRDYEAAEAGLTSLLEQQPDFVPALMSRVRLMDWKNDEVGLRQSVDQLSAYAGDRPDALSLVIDHSRTLPSDILNRAETLFAGESSQVEEQASLGFALALHYDRLGEYDRAFKLAKLANERIAVYRNAEQTTETRNQIRSAFEERLKRAGALTQSVQGVAKSKDQSRFIYLVGAPRTGSSLIQSVLAAGEGCVSVGERTSLYPYLMDVVQRPVETASVERLIQDLSVADRAGLERERKLADVIIDKTPHHVFVVGLLQKVNPKSSFIQVFRDAGDVALSMFLRPFSDFFAEATNLDSVADMLEIRLDAYRQWTDLGLKLSAFSYDQFTSAPSEQGQRLFNRVGLEWNPEFLDPKSRPEAVQTFSSRQVRKDIQKPSKPHWEAYREFAPDSFDRLSAVSAAQKAIIDTKV